MTDHTETARALLRDADNYLSALHGSVARHDHLAANFGCAGCELRDRITAALPELAAAAAVPAGQAPATGQAGLRKRVDGAVHEVLNQKLGGGEWTLIRPLLVDAVLSVLPAPTDRAAVLSEAADRLWALANRTTERGAGVLWAAEWLRRMAAESPEPPVHGESVAALAGYGPDRRDQWDDQTADTGPAVPGQADNETPFIPPAHYRRDDGVDCCVHTIPVGPDSCPACRELHDEQPAAGPTVVDEVVASLTAKAQALSVEAEQEMRRDLEDQAQVWHEAAEMARRAARKAQRRTQLQPAAGAQQPKEA